MHSRDRCAGARLSLSHLATLLLLAAQVATANHPPTSHMRMHSMEYTIYAATDAVPGSGDSVAIVGAGGAVHPGGNTLDVNQTAEGYPPLLKFVFAMLVLLGMTGIACFLYFVAFAACLPRAGGKAAEARDSRWGSFVSQRRKHIIAAVLQGAVLLLMIVLAGLDSYTTFSAPSQTITVGLTRIRVYASDGGLQSKIDYNCQASGYTPPQRSECESAQAGAVITMLLIVTSIFSSLIVIALVIWSLRGGKFGHSGFHPRLWSAAGACAASTLLALLFWPLTSHLMLQLAFQASTGLDAQLSASWALLWPALFLAWPLYFFWRGAVDYTPVVGSPEDAAAARAADAADMQDREMALAAQPDLRFAAGGEDGAVGDNHGIGPSRINLHHAISGGEDHDRHAPDGAHELHEHDLSAADFEDPEAGEGHATHEIDRFGALPPEDDDRADYHLAGSALKGDGRGGFVGNNLGNAGGGFGRLE